MTHHKKILPNGLRVITIPEPGSLAVTIFVLVEAGSNYEAKEVSGISHFLEHMCFKGTKKRPKAIDISSEFDSLGAQYNAFTSHEFTGYYAKVASDKFEKALDIVSDIYLDPNFDEAEIEKEKGVIVEEINMYEDLPQHKVQDLILEVLYGDQPAGRNIAGDKENVKKLNRSSFLKYRGEHYLPHATTVVIAGNFDDKKAIESVSEKFASMKEGEKMKKEIVLDKGGSAPVKIQKKASDQTHLVIALRTFDAHDKRNYTMDVLSQILGGGMSSRLFQKVREELGAAYYVRSSHETFTDHGFLEMSAGADNKRVKEVMGAMIGELGKLSREKVEAKEIERAKESIIGNLFLGLETSDAVAGYFGIQEIVKGRMETPEEYAEKIRKVTAEDVLAVAEECVKNGDLSLALIGPFEESSDFVKMLKL